MREVLIVDDLPEAQDMLQAIVREAYPSAFCHRADGLKEANALCARVQFDLALVDLRLGDGQGIQLIEQLSVNQPTCASVVASIYDNDESLFQALQAGAQGYLLKGQDPAWLVRQLRGIGQGQPPLSPAIARRLLRHFRGQSRPRAALEPQLTQRERDVLGLLAQGVHIAEIGSTLGISRHTVGDHVKNIYRKLNISSRAEAALRARSMGLI
jgi:DNA-binding NarL/FixJ family response regulator